MSENDIKEMNVTANTVATVDSYVTVDSEDATANSADPELLRMLDRGIDDMEAGHELPLDEAMVMVDQLLARRRAERNSSVVFQYPYAANAANG